MDNTEQIQNSQLDSFLWPQAAETYINSISGSDDFNITGVAYRASGNLLICREISKVPMERVNKGGRGSITGFSKHSGIRMRRYLRECTTDYTQMVTLTYPAEFPGNGTACKEHLRRFLQELQREFNRRTGVVAFDHSSFWFLEFQERGAPHFHIFTNWCPNKQWVSQRWYDIVWSNDEKHLRAGTRVEFLRAGRRGTISYASKYAAKLAQKVAPVGFENIGRWWGVYGVRSTMSADTFVSRRAYKDVYVKGAIISLKNQLEELVLEGKARTLVRKEGFLLVVLNDKQTESNIFDAICRIQSRAANIGDMFMDAEVDYGACYSR